MSQTNRSGENAHLGVNERSFPVCCYCGACAAFIPDFEKYSDEEVFKMPDLYVKARSTTETSVRRRNKNTLSGKCRYV
jgi:coenzyme F420-reducing hydrogenase beta subunit